MITCNYVFYIPRFFVINDAWDTDSYIAKPMFHKYRAIAISVLSSSVQFKAIASAWVATYFYLGRMAPLQLMLAILVYQLVTMPRKVS